MSREVLKNDIKILLNQIVEMIESDASENVQSLVSQIHAELETLSPVDLFVTREYLNDSIKNISMLLPTIDNNAINGSIIYIDSYGNGITNISYDLFEKVRKHRDYEILIKSNFYKINCIHTHYYEVEGGELFAVFNSLKLLEIGISYGNMANQLNLNIEDIVRIKFID